MIEQISHFTPVYIAVVTTSLRLIHFMLTLKRNTNAKMEHPINIKIDHAHATANSRQGQGCGRETDSQTYLVKLQLSESYLH